MFDANSLSPFRRKNNGFIIPSYHYNKSKINNENKEDDDLVSINESKVQSDHISSIEKNDDKKSFENNYKVENITNSSKNNYVGVSKYSLSSIKIEKEAKQKLIDEKSSIEKLNDKFSFEDLNKEWKNYIKIKQANGQTIMSSLLEMTNIKLKENHFIILETNSESNKNEIIKEMASILSYLKESLNNYKIKFEVNIISNDKSKTIFTSKEKYDYLKDLNPHIKLLINEFKIQL
tara:strand:- start:447 stop:1148 length:702 start_codon:yes stop_codon:yes gene_type:complete